MHTFMRFSIVPAILAGAGLFLYAQDAPTPLPAKGKVLLLRTGSAMEGDIERVGTQYCIRRGASEVWIAEDRAFRLCTDWEDAYRFALTQINTKDAGDRVRLARWCHLYRLTDRALEQARFALELQPTNSDARQLVLVLERATREPAVKPTPTKVAAAEQPKSSPALALDVSFDTQVAFATKVQPILMNRCAACHASGAGGKFHLERVGDNSQKAGTQRNLAAVLAYVDLDRPVISPLIVKAVTRHGDAQAAPIKDRSAPPLQSMQQWIVETIAKNPQLKDYRNAAKPSLPTPEPKSVFPTQRSEVPPPRVEPVRNPIALPMQRDWCHPDHFNEWAHPQVFGKQSASK